jgi:hypothetical protein
MTSKKQATASFATANDNPRSTPANKFAGDPGLAAIKLPLGWGTRKTGNRGQGTVKTKADSLRE